MEASRLRNQVGGSKAADLYERTCRDASTIDWGREALCWRLRFPSHLAWYDVLQRLFTRVYLPWTTLREEARAPHCTNENLAWRKRHFQWTQSRWMSEDFCPLIFWLSHRIFSKWDSCCSRLNFRVLLLFANMTVHGFSKKVKFLDPQIYNTNAFVKRVHIFL